VRQLLYSLIGMFWPAVTFKIDLIRGAAGKQLVRPRAAIKVQISLQVSFCDIHRTIGMKVNFLILDGSPELLHKDIIAPAALAIHADPDSIPFE
jgi:hypothetical protein